MQVQNVSTMTDKKCGRCYRELSSSLLKTGPRCSRCKKSLHYECSSVSARTWTAYTEVEKEKWLCVDCRTQSLYPSSVRTPQPETTSTSKRGISSVISPESNNQSKQAHKRLNMGECTLEALEAMLDKKMADLETRIVQTVKRELATEITTLNAKVTQLETSNKQLKDEVKALKRTVASQSQQSRKDEVIVSGFPYVEAEKYKPMVTVQRILAAVKHPSVTMQDVSTGHYLKTGNTNTNIQPFVIKFARRCQKDAFLTHIKQMDPKPTAALFANGNPQTKFFVNNHLSPETSALLRAAKELKKPEHGGWSQVYTMNYLVYARKAYGGPRIQITSMEQLEELKGTSASS